MVAAGTNSPSSITVNQLLAAKPLKSDDMRQQTSIRAHGLLPTLLTSKAIAITDASAGKCNSSMRPLSSWISTLEDKVAAPTFQEPDPSTDGAESEENDVSNSEPDSSGSQQGKEPEGHAPVASPWAPEAKDGQPLALGSSLHAAGECRTCYVHPKSSACDGVNWGHGEDGHAETPFQLAPPPGLAPTRSVANIAPSGVPPQSPPLHLPPAEPLRPHGAPSAVPPVPGSLPGTGVLHSAAHVGKPVSAAAAGAAAVTTALCSLDAVQSASAHAMEKEALFATQPLAGWMPMTPPPLTPTQRLQTQHQTQWQTLQTPSYFTLMSEHLRAMPLGEVWLAERTTSERPQEWPVLATVPAAEPPVLLLAELMDKNTRPDRMGPEIDTPSTPASKPAAVAMPDYEGEVPMFNPRTPVKKRLPDWSP